MTEWFDWDEHNVEHITRHGIEPEEAEEALTDPLRIGAPARNVLGEQRWALLGATGAGRILFVVFTRRRAMVRVITARDASDAQKRRYRRR